MKAIFLLIFLACIGFTQAQTSCNDFHTGKFVLKAPGGNTLIERNEKYQFETAEDGKVKIKLKVTWISECVYELRFDSFIKKSKSTRDWPKNMVLTVEILETTSNAYHFLATSNIFPDSKTDGMIEKLE
ncbi:MAG: hypothetical protein K1X55_01860 [Chitinophagales bacterium]|nr:hypothetical protein [Chitinophagales bacterium]